MIYFKDQQHSDIPTLPTFYWAVKAVVYDWFSGGDYVEVYFTPTIEMLEMRIAGLEPLGTHSRSYQLPPSNNGTPDSALNYILSLDEFKNSIEQ